MKMLRINQRKVPSKRPGYSAINLFQSVDFWLLKIGISSWDAGLHCPIELSLVPTSSSTISLHTLPPFTLLCLSSAKEVEVNLELSDASCSTSERSIAFSIIDLSSTSEDSKTPKKRPFFCSKFSSSSIPDVRLQAAAISAESIIFFFFLLLLFDFRLLTAVIPFSSPSPIVLFDMERFEKLQLSPETSRGRTAKESFLPPYLADIEGEQPRRRNPNSVGGARTGERRRRWWREDGGESPRSPRGTPTGAGTNLFLLLICPSAAPSVQSQGIFEPRQSIYLYMHFRKLLKISIYRSKFGIIVSGGFTRLQIFCVLNKFNVSNP